MEWEGTWSLGGDYGHRFDGVMHSSNCVPTDLAAHLQISYQTILAQSLEQRTERWLAFAHWCKNLTSAGWRTPYPYHVAEWCMSNYHGRGVGARRGEMAGSHHCYCKGFKAFKLLPLRLLVHGEFVVQLVWLWASNCCRNCPLDGVLPTTNHLESFNGVLKQKNLHHWQRGGQHLHIDVLVKLLITKILPSFFQQRSVEQNDVSIWEAQMHSLPGGESLLKKTLATNSGSAVLTITYQVPDESWGIVAAEILQNKEIDIPSISPTGLTFVCHSSLTLAFETDPVSYCIT